MLTKLQFEPETGLADHTAYLTAPDSEDAAREQLQRPHNQTRDYLNDVLLAELQESGASELGAGPLYEGDTAGSVMEKLLALRGAIDDIVLGGVPDGSITTEKLSGDLVIDGGEY